LYAALITSPGGAWRTGGRRHRPRRHPGHARRGGGVHGRDIPGENNCGPIIHDDPFLADGKVQFLGQPVAVVVAREMLYAREAAAKAQVKVFELPAIITIEQALEAHSFVIPTKSLAQGDAAGAIAAAPHRLKAARAAASRSSSTWKATSPTPCRAKTTSSRCTCPPSTPTATSAKPRRR
jgi:CO/xanthine dehydrogenase Mo-binding subunit